MGAGVAHREDTKASFRQGHTGHGAALWAPSGHEPEPTTTAHPVSTDHEGKVNAVLTAFAKS